MIDFDVGDVVVCVDAADRSHEQPGYLSRAYPAWERLLTARGLYTVEMLRPYQSTGVGVQLVELGELEKPVPGAPGEFWWGLPANRFRKAFTPDPAVSLDVDVREREPA